MCPSSPQQLQMSQREFVVNVVSIFFICCSPIFVAIEESYTQCSVGVSTDKAYNILWVFLVVTQEVVCFRNSYGICTHLLFIIIVTKLFISNLFDKRSVATSVRIEKEDNCLVAFTWRFCQCFFLFAGWFDDVFFLLDLLENCLMIGNASFWFLDGLDYIYEFIIVFLIWSWSLSEMVEVT